MIALGWAATRSPTLRQSDWPSARAGLALARDPRPEDPAVEDDESRGQDEQHEGRCDDDPDGAGEPEAAGRREERQQQRQHAEHHRDALETTASAVRRRASDMASRRSGACAARRGSGR